MGFIYILDVRACVVAGISALSVKTHLRSRDQSLLSYLHQRACEKTKPWYSLK